MDDNKYEDVFTERRTSSRQLLAYVRSKRSVFIPSILDLVQDENAQKQHQARFVTTKYPISIHSIFVRLWASQGVENPGYEYSA